MPYISASIIFQMLTYVLPSLESMRKEGEAGRRKITQYTRYATLGLALVAVLRHRGGLAVAAGAGAQSGFMFVFICMVSLVTGTIFLMWLGEQITERGLATASRS